MRKQFELMLSGKLLNAKPPQPQIQFIERAGEVVISFDQDMNVLPELSIVRDGVIEVEGRIFPVLNIEVIPSASSDPETLQFDWFVNEMTKRQVKI